MTTEWGEKAIEQVARAIWADIRHATVVYFWPCRAIWSALRKRPIPIVGEIFLNPAGDRKKGGDDIWRAMIDAALKG